MNFGEIKELLTAGFTPDQIMTLTTSGAIPSVPDPSPAADPITPAAVVESPAEVGEDNPSSPTEQETKDQPDPLEEIRQQLQQLKDENTQLRDQIQTNNIRDRTVPTVSAPDAASTLAEIIRPSFK